jgi:hypothetical protein
LKNVAQNVAHPILGQNQYITFTLEDSSPTTF